MLRQLMRYTARGLRISYEARNRIWQKFSAISAAQINRVRHTRDVNQAFLSIFGKQDVYQQLRFLDHFRILGIIIEEFGRIERLRQDDAHRFTVGTHSLEVVRIIERIARGAPPDKAGELPENWRHLHRVYTEINNPLTLFLAALLHDIGKSTGKDDDISGAQIAQAIARRLGLESEAERVGRLVRLDTALNSIAGRKDVNIGELPEDNLGEIAFELGDPDFLKMLYLLTVADGLGMRTQLRPSESQIVAQVETARPKLPELYKRLDERFRGETAERERLIERLLDMRLLKGLDEEIVRHIHGMPFTYLAGWVADQGKMKNIVRDISALAHLKRRGFIMRTGKAIQGAVDGRGLPITVITYDRAHLLKTIVGASSLCGYNIQGAEIFTRRDGIAIDTLYVDPQRSFIPLNKELRALSRVLGEFLTTDAPAQPLQIDGLVKLIEEARLGLFRAPQDRMNQAGFVFTDGKFPFLGGTKLTVRGYADRLFLLFDQVSVISSLAEIVNAKVTTSEQGIDNVFYLRDRLTGGQLSAFIRWEIQEGLRKALSL